MELLLIIEVPGIEPVTILLYDYSTNHSVQPSFFLTILQTNVAVTAVAVTTALPAQQEEEKKKKQNTYKHKLVE